MRASMEKRIIAPSRATAVDISKLRRKGRRIRLTEVTLDGDNPPRPAVSQLDGTVDTP